MKLSFLSGKMGETWEIGFSKMFPVVNNAGTCHGGLPMGVRGRCMSCWVGEGAGEAAGRALRIPGNEGC